ncbi:protein of unknown function [Nitrospira japonica]|uniref:Uncharacterized protein n=1 Tax=Nitrospira japonica TaxID=1325564 RepID=A0A1W1I8N8_9BACT|nr:protein of unknown function [Nitrospira japonica]
MWWSWPLLRLGISKLNLGYLCCYARLRGLTVSKTFHFPQKGHRISQCPFSYFTPERGRIGC